jgi:amidohydrolase
MDFENLIELRRKLHSLPELSGKEKNTANIILSFIKGLKPTQIITGVGGYGIIAVWQGSEEGPEVLFRGDIDALPIEETSGISYKSKNKKVAHLCGHDGHTAILCGLAQRLYEIPPKKGRVLLLFQPSEENGQGARLVLEDSAMKEFAPDYVFALHNIPGYPLHSVILKNGSFSAAVNSIIIKFKGKTAHAAEPENGINPALAIAQILKKCHSIQNTDEKHEAMRIITPVYAILGEKAYGTSAGKGEVHLTLRCWNNENLRQLENDVEAIAKTISKNSNLAIDISYTQTFYANENHYECVDQVRNAALKNEMPIIEKNTPFKWGEDFGFFTSRFKGCMFGLGAGENHPALHNPDYDFPEELIESGVKMFSQIINQINGK